MTRWTATAYYRTDAGIIDIEWEFNEIEDLHILVERGPSWYALDRIEIKLAAPSTQTIEGAIAE